MFSSSVWNLITQADFFTWCILLFLFAMSVVCVAIIFFKFMYFRREMSALHTFKEHMKSADTMQDVAALVQKTPQGLGSELVSEILQTIKTLVSRKGSAKAALDKADVERLELLAGQALDNKLLEAEMYLPILGTSAAVSPLIGLFGTVWGLIHSFVRISQERSADISVVAPGIAEALTTTLAGLIVAIPAFIFFHYFSSELRRVEQQLGHLADLCVSVAQKTLS